MEYNPPNAAPQPDDAKRTLLLKAARALTDKFATQPSVPIEFTMAREVHAGFSSATAHPITFTGDPIPAGRLVVITAAYTGFTVEMLSVDKGGTLNPVVATSGGAGFGDSGGPCGWLVTTSEITSPLTVTFNAATASCELALWEFEFANGVPTLVAANRASNSGGGTTGQGPTFNLPAGNHLILHTSVQTGSATAITDPYNPPDGASFFPAVGYAAAFNTSDGTGPTWTYNASSNAGMSALVFGKNAAPYLTQTICDFSAGTEGADLTVALLKASTKGWGAGRWRIEGAAASTALKFRAAAAKALQSATGLLCDGNNYPAGTGGAFGVEYTTGAPKYVVLDYSASSGGGASKRNSKKFSSQIYFRSSLPDNDTSNCDIHSIYTDNGGFANCKFRGHANGVNRCLELEIPGGATQSPVIILANTWYRLLLEYDEDGPHTLRVYDMAGNEVGSITENHTGLGSVVNVQFGNSNATVTGGHTFWFGALKTSAVGGLIAA